MARTVKDLEAYLAASGRRFETTEDGTIVISPNEAGKPPIGARVVDGTVVFSVDIGPAPSADKQAEVYRKLLERNATDLLYCAYGLRDGTIVLSSAHEIENLDLNEVQAILSDVDVALAQHLRDLLALLGKPSSPSQGKN